MVRIIPFHKIFQSGLQLRKTDVILAVLLFPIALALYILGVRVLVNCRSHGIGHLAVEPAWFLARKTLYREKIDGRAYILLAENGAVANAYLGELIREYFYLFRSRNVNAILNQVSRFRFISVDIGIAPSDSTARNRMFTICRNVRHRKMIRDIQAFRDERSKNFVNISKEVLERGRENLEVLGIGKDEWFVCLHAGEITTTGIWDYQRFRRNRISDYAELVEHIRENHGKVVRMGHKDVPAISSGIPIIDYPKSSVWSDWMDIFLIHDCRYFIGCQSGLQLVAVLLGKPQLLTNIIPWFWVNGFDGDLYVPKLLRSMETGDYVTVHEYVENELHLWQYDVPAGFEVVPNNGTDLINAAIEMEINLRNGVPVEGDLQRRWKLSSPIDSQCRQSEARICTSFLERHKDKLL